MDRLVLAQDTVTVTAITNYFNPLEYRDTRHLEVAPVGEYCNIFYGEILDEFEICVSVNGRILTDHILDFVPIPGDHVGFTLVPQGGDGKNPIATIAMLALIVVTAVYAPPLAAHLIGVETASSVAVSIVSTTMMMAGGMLINSVFPPQLPDMDQVNNTGGANSPTYGWDTQANSTSEGIFLPVLYGKHRVVPVLISHYIDVNVDTREEVLNMLFAVAEGPIENITDVEINDEDYTSYGEFVTTTIRLGSSDQLVIDKFSDVRTTTYVGLELIEGEAAIERTTNGNTIDALIGTISFPQGLFFANTQDANDNLYGKVSIKVEYRVTNPPGSWITLEETIVVDNVNEPFKVPYRVDNLTPDQYDIRASATVPTAFSYTIATLHGVDSDWVYSEIVDIGVVDCVDLYAVWRNATVQYRLTKTDPALGDWTEWDYTINTRDIRVVTRGIQFRIMGYASYSDLHVDITSFAIDPDDALHINTVLFDSFQEIIYDSFRYPRTALLAVSALATDKLSGGLPRVTCLADRKYVDVWVPDSEDYVIHSASNPAWAAWDMLHNSQYGGSVPHTRIVYTDWLAWALENSNGESINPGRYDATETYTSGVAVTYDGIAYRSLQVANIGNEPSSEPTWWGLEGNILECNIYIDTGFTFKRALDMVAILGRATIVQLGSKYTVNIDKEETAVQGFLFTDGNIIEDSFNEVFMPMDDRANSIEVTYFDENYKYKRQIVEVQSADFDTTGRPINKTQMTMFGCVVRGQAIRQAMLLLNCNRYITITASFEADLDAIVCMPGDVVRVQHNVPVWGWGGRVIASSGNDTVTLDSAIEFVAGEEYKIVIRNPKDDTFYEDTPTLGYKVVTNPASGNSVLTDQVMVSSPFTIMPVFGDLFYLYTTTIAAKLMRVKSIERSANNRRKVSCIEYNTNVYNDTLTLPSYESGSGLSFISNLVAYITPIPGLNSTYTRGVSLSWHGYKITTYYVFMRLKWDTYWQFLGETNKASFVKKNVGVNRIYEFSVNTEKNPDSGNTVEILVPNDIFVSNLAVSQSVAYVQSAAYHNTVLTWTNPSNFEGDIRNKLSIEYRLSSDTEWIIHAEIPKTTNFSFTGSDVLPIGTYDFRVCIIINGTGSSIYTQLDDVEITEFTLWDAIAALPVEGGVIHCKNGVYGMWSGESTLEVGVSPLIPTDKPIVFKGESKEGTFFENWSGENGIDYTDRKSSLNFKDLTIRSQNTSVWSNMIDLNGTVSGENTGQVTLQNVHFILNGVGTHLSQGDRGFDADKHGGRLILSDVTGISGERCIVARDCNEVSIFKSTFDNQTQDSVLINGGKDVDLVNVDTTNVHYGGISIGIYDLVRNVRATGCNAYGRVDSQDGGMYLMSFGAMGISVENNYAEAVHTRSTLAETVGIGFEGCVDGFAKSNIVRIETNNYGFAIGIEIDFCDNLDIMSNNIRVHNFDTTNDRFGIMVQSGNSCRIASNTTDQVSLTGHNIGVYIDAASADNRVISNTFKNCDDPVENFGDRTETKDNVEDNELITDDRGRYFK